MCTLSGSCVGGGGAEAGAGGNRRFESDIVLVVLEEDNCRSLAWYSAPSNSCNSKVDVEEMGGPRRRCSLDSEGGRRMSLS